MTYCMFCNNSIFLTFHTDELILKNMKSAQHNYYSIEYDCRIKKFVLDSLKKLILILIRQINY